MSNIEVLIVYYSAKGSVAQLARAVARGVDEVPGASARVRTVPKVAPVYEPGETPVPVDGPPYATTRDLEECHALALGSPTRFGQMAAALRYFLDATSEQWLQGRLAGKPAGVFTATSSLHGGQESTLLGMMLPLLHHGMLVVGLPYTENALHQTEGGGSPYGPGHLNRLRSGLSAHEQLLGRALGRRLAEIALKLNAAPE